MVNGGLWLAVSLPLAAAAQDAATSPGGPERAAPAAPAATASERLSRLHVFRPDFYADRRPRTALDIVVATPGFQLAAGSAGRGLAGAAGNVLINGARPPAKAAPITQVLAAIPADEVRAVLLVPPGTMDVDMAGYPVLLYLITSTKQGLERSVTVTATDRGRLGRTRSVAAEARLSRPRRLVTANLQHSDSRTRSQGALVSPLVGQTTARRSGGAQSELVSTQLSTLAQWDLQRGARLQARLNLSQSESLGRPVPDADMATLDTASLSSQRGGDLATELRWPLAARGGELALTTLRSQRESTSTASLRSAGQESVSRSRSRTASGETALRGALRLKLRRQWHLEVGADHAANGQDGNFSYRVNGVEISVPGAASRVEEQRDGVFAGATWTPDPYWTAEAALRRETSVLRNRAGPGQAARFGDLLPRVAATWTPRSDIRLQGSAERKVGQLAFSQFLASVALADDIVTAGAQALEPERSWTYALDYEQRFGERGLLTAGVERERTENSIDATVLDDGLQVSANVGSATVDTLHADVTAPLDRMGLAGGLLTASRSTSRSRTIDPVTGQRRPVSSTPSSASLSLRQDLGQGSWGMSLAGGLESTAYGVRQVTRMRSDPSASVYGEWRPHESLALRLTWSNGGRMQTDSWLYALPREAGQSADLDYLAATWSPPTWQARAEWTPTSLARVTFGASTGGNSRMTGMTTVPGGGREVARLLLPGAPTLSMEVKLRW